MVRGYLAGAGLLAVAVLQAPAPARASGFDMRRVQGSVVFVAIYDANGKLKGNGSGFVVAPGVVVTNYHVASEGSALAVVPNGDDGAHKVVAKVIASSAAHDLAVLSAPGFSGRALPVAQGSPVPGVPVYAMGFPGLADELNVESRVTASLTVGNVSRVFSGLAGNGNAQNPTLLVQHTAQIAPGNSGGPLFDQCQRVVGINTQMAMKEGSSFLFSVSSTELLPLLRKAGVAASLSGEACGDTPAVGSEPPAGGAQGPAPQTPPAGGGDALPPASPAAGPDASENRQINQDAKEAAQRQAAEARKRAAAARAAQKRAEAGNNLGEARKQRAIAERAEKTAAELDAYSDKLDKQLKESVEPMERWLPIGLGFAGLAGFGGLLAWLATRRNTLAAKRSAHAARLGQLERDLAASQPHDVLFESSLGGFKLPGTKLERGLVVGRSADNADVVLPRPDVSRKHAWFVRRAGRVYVKDLDSSNGLFLNGRRLRAGVEEEINTGDTLGFGPDNVFTATLQ